MDDWLRSTGNRGFYYNIDASWKIQSGNWVYGVNEGSNIPEQEGWKKALLEFTGYQSLNALYSDLEAWVQSADAAAVDTILQYDVTEVHKLTSFRSRAAS